MKTVLLNSNSRKLKMTKVIAVLLATMFAASAFAAASAASAASAAKAASGAKAASAAKPASK